MKNKLTIAVLLIAFAFVVMIPLFFTLPGETMLWGEAQNFGHTPLFGILAILVLLISRLFFANKFKRQLNHYWLAFGVAVFCGGLVEILQMFLPGDPDFGDFVRDILGAGAFLCFFMYFDKSFDWTGLKHSVSKRKLPLIISVVLIIIALIPGLLWAGAYLHRDMNFPLICGFDSIWEWKFIGTKNTLLKSVSPPEKWNKPLGDRVGQLELFAADTSGFYIEEPGEDWNEYKYLNFEVFSELDTPIELHVGIEDFLGKDIDEDRFTKTLIVNPASNEFSFPIKDIRNGPLSRKLNIAELRDINFFVIKPKVTIKLYIDDLRLRP